MTTRLSVHVFPTNNDVSSSKPCSQGRGGIDALHANNSCVVCCGGSRCKTCKHLVVGNSFASNVTGKSYNISCPRGSIRCGTKNVIYVISCRKCGVQYVGETSQTLRARFNNHRNRLKQLCGLYLYHHFNSDGHSLDDINIMPIEEVVLEQTDGMTLPSKRLQREEYWYRELCSVYPYGLNDNVRGVGNVSKSDERLIVYTLFNTQKRTFRKRRLQRNKRKVNVNTVEEQLKSRLNKYKSIDFTLSIRAYVLNLPRSKLGIVVDVTENLVLHEKISARTLLLVKDLVAYRLRCKVMQNKTNVDRESCDRQYMNVPFHDKGMDMVDLPRILNSKKVGAAIPNYLKGPPPIVSYTYTRTIGGKIFNNRRAVEELDVENGTEGMQCSCSSSEYKYDLCGHVLTGDLSIIRDVKLRNLIRKGPVFREQNNIDWEVNLKNCKASVSKYVKKWARIASVDRQVLRDWEETVHECIEQRVRCLKQRHVNRRKKHVLKNRVHLDYLNKLHENYADKTANNVIVVCKKYYLDVVLKELESTNTYQEVHSDCISVVSRHLKYMVQNDIFVQEQQEHLPSFYWLPKLHKNPYGARFIAASNKCTTKQLSSLLTSCFKTILIHYKQYCSGIYKNTGVT